MQHKAAIPVIRLYFRFFIKKKKSVENQEDEVVV